MYEKGSHQFQTTKKSILRLVPKGRFCFRSLTHARRLGYQSELGYSCIDANFFASHSNKAACFKKSKDIDPRGRSNRISKKTTAPIVNLSVPTVRDSTALWRKGKRRTFSTLGHGCAKKLYAASLNWRRQTNEWVACGKKMKVVEILLTALTSRA